MLAKIKVKVNLLAQTKSKYFGKVLAQNGYDTSFFLLGWTPVPPLTATTPSPL